MMPFYGYAGKLLLINLTTGKAVTEPLNAETMRRYGGGVGFAARFLYDELKASSDPLGPDNKPIFAAGPLTGTTSGADHTDKGGT